MNKIITHILTFSMLLAACHNRNVSSVPDKANDKYLAVTVKDSRGLDGCAFLLVKEDGLKMEAVNLPDSLKVDGLRLGILYVPVKSSMSICMAGKIIELTDIKVYE